MKIAALQLNCIFADSKQNIEKIGVYVKQASENGIDLLVLPEFFPSAIGFSSKMNHVALEGAYIRKVIKKLSSDFGIIIGGSYLYFDGTASTNTFDLVFPNGNVFSHHKDIPTQFENCYYTNGDTNPILHTPIGEIGVALCWEMIRYDTLKRLSGKVDIVLAGSCWWDLPIDAPKEREPLRQYNQKLALETPVTFAELLHVPVIHASHCGQITAYNFPANDRLQTRQFVGAAQIIDADGTVISRKEFTEGEGLVMAEMPLGKSRRQSADMDNKRYWIPDLPDSYIKAWNEINPIGNTYYKEHMLPYYLRHDKNNRVIKLKQKVI